MDASTVGTGFQFFSGLLRQSIVVHLIVASILIVSCLQSHVFLALLECKEAVDILILGIQQAKLLFSEPSRQEVHANGNASLDDNGESNSHDANTAEGDESSKQGGLNRSVLMQLGTWDKVTIGEGSIGVLGRLHEPVGDSAPELVSGKRSETHEQEDSVQDWNGDNLEGTQEENRYTDEQMNEKVRQPSFLNRNDVSVLILLGKGSDVGNGSDCCSNKPRKSEHRVNSNHDGNDNGIIVESFSVS